MNNKLLLPLAFIACTCVGACHSSGGAADDNTIIIIETPEQTIAQATALMQTTLAALVSPDLRMKSLMTVHQRILDVPVIYDRTQLAGRTFVLGSADGEYVLDDLRMDAPANGTRFILYEFDQDGLKQPLNETGYVDSSWTEEIDRVLVEMTAVAEGQTFLSTSGDGEKQLLELPNFPIFGFGLSNVANIKLAARRLSVDGVLDYMGSQISFDYERHATYGNAFPGIVITASNEWHVELGGGVTNYLADNRFIPNFDSDQTVLFELLTPQGKSVEFTMITLRHHFVQGETRIDGDLIDAAFVSSGSPFVSALQEAFVQMAFTDTNIQKLMAPAMYALLVVQ